MWGKRTVSVVFPAYNEEENILSAIEDFSTVDYVDEVVVVDNNSTDRTAELVRSANARLVTETKQGYGCALQRGLREAKTDMIILAEPDGTFLGSDVVKLLAFADDCDLVLGSRTRREFIGPGANMGLLRRAGNGIAAKLLQVLFDGPPLSDCGCTLRLISREAAQRIHDRFTSRGAPFAPEMVVLALLDKQRVVEVPVNYRARIGTSKITGSTKRMLLVGFRMIRLIIAYRVRSWLRRA